MYEHVPHSEKLRKANNHLHHIHKWFTSIRRPDDISNKVYIALNGSVFDRPIAAFRVIPYFVRQRINVPPLDELIDITSH